MRDIETDARMMAEAVNGGSWDRDYTKAQKEGWRLKVRWAMARYGSESPEFYPVTQLPPDSSPMLVFDDFYKHWITARWSDEKGTSEGDMCWRDWFWGTPLRAPTFWTYMPEAPK